MKREASPLATLHNTDVARATHPPSDAVPSRTPSVHRMPEFFGRNLARLSVIALCGFLANCAIFRIARTPVRSIEHPAAETDDGPRRVLVMLPGFGDRPGAFERHGFIEAVHTLDPTIEIVAVDAHFGYYRKNTIVTRVYDDVIAPAIASGADEIWLLGISMGGSGALSIAELHADEIDGIILLAPYTGGSDFAEEIREAGGLDAWETHTVADEKVRPAHFRSLWAWMDGYTTGEQRPTLYLGVGTDDGFERGADLIGEHLPEGHYQTLPGGHDWTVWGPLFDGFLLQAFGE